MSSDYYNGNKLLSMKTLTLDKPELFFCIGNRTAGKSFFFKRWFLRRAVKYNEKFVLFVRLIDDVKDAVEGFFSDIGPISFPGHTMSQKPLLKGKAARLYFDNKEVGYVIALKYLRPIKANSALFCDAIRGLMDEFCDEDGRYVTNEMRNFHGIRISIARGGGEHSRYFPVYLISNKISIFNPYFDYYRIASKLQNRTKYLRGDSWVLEQTFNEVAAERLRSNFKSIGEEQLKSSAGNEYLLDNRKYVEKIPGQKMPVLSYIHNSCVYGMWQAGSMYYISSKLSHGLPVALSFNIDDHYMDDTWVPPNAPLVKRLRELYMMNCVLFESEKCKHSYLDICTLIK